jgi:excinuclease ABC subunit A
VGFEYLTLDRGGHAVGWRGQRIRLATQIGSSLVGAYILDEPSIGLHQRDRRLDTLVRLRDLGNTVLVVEHERQSGPPTT